LSDNCGVLINNLRERRGNRTGIIDFPGQTADLQPQHVNFLFQMENWSSPEG
jgi:hypothetical protein